MKRARLPFIVALAVPVCLYAAVVGTNGNDILFFQGTIQPVSTTLTNPYSGAQVTIDGEYNVNVEIYDGMGGFDTLFLTSSGDYLELDNGGPPTLISIERMIAGDGSDVINLASPTLTYSNVLVEAGRADDLIWANIGDDTLNGFDGDDTIDGGPGNDIVNGQNDNDLLFGGDGNDTINGGAGNNQLFGNAGTDLFQSTFGAVAYVDGGSGVDTIAYFSGHPRATFSITQLGPNEFRVFKPDVVDDHLLNVEFAQFTDVTVDLSTFAYDALGAGAYHTCAIEADRTVICWGSNSAGQSAPPADLFTDISAGALHTCGVKEDGTLACWGDNAFGQATPPTGEFIQVAAGDRRSCGIRSNGIVACWGENLAPSFTSRDSLEARRGTSYAVTTVGSPSVTTITQSGAPAGVTFTDNGNSTGTLIVTASAAAGTYPITLTATNGVPPDATQNFTLVIQSSGTGSPITGVFTRISESLGGHACAAVNDGLGPFVPCWGDNTFGQATPPAGTFVNLVTAGQNHSCGWSSSGGGTVACWGDNSSGQSTVPGGRFDAVDAGGLHTCGIEATGGSGVCWGDNSSGQATPAPGSFTQITAGLNHTCGVKTDGALACWGDNSFGQAPAFPGDPDGDGIAGDADNCPLDANADQLDTDGDGLGDVCDPNPVNDAPLAADDSYSTGEDTPLTVSPAGVLTNDTDEDGDALSAVLVSATSHGTLTLNADGSFVYTPGSNYHGGDTFTYKANDGTIDSNVATVSITVTGAPDAPAAGDDGYSTDEDTALTVAAPGVLINDSDADGDTLTVIQVSPPSHGTLTLNADGSFSYVPAANYHGPDSFTYKARDGTADSNVATVSINIVPLNDTPFVANSISDVTVPQDSADTVLDLSTTFDDEDIATNGDSLTLAVSANSNPALVTADLVGTTLTLDYAAGQNGSATISVSATDEWGDEVVDTFLVTVNPPPGPTIAITDVTLVERNSGSTNGVFTVSLSSASAQTVTVTYAVAAGTATAGSDYTASSGPVTFAPGVVTQTVTIPVRGDLIDEVNETFFVNLSAPTNASIADGQGLGMITDNDTSNIKIGDRTIPEGDAGSVGVVFTVSLSVQNSRTVTVDYTTGTTGTAQNGVDYGPTAGTLTFTPGVTSRTVTVQVNGDTLDEAHETFFVTLAHAVEAPIGDGSAKGTITDDDPAPTVSIADLAIVEGNSSTKNAIFTVTLSAASGQTVKVNYQTANDTAVAPGDYTAKSGTVTFNAGVTSRTITIKVVGELVDEADETFFVNLISAQQATILDGQAVATIVDNDP